MCLRRQLLRNICPIQLAFLRLIVWRMFLSSFTLYNLHYLRGPSSISSPSFSSTTFQNFPGTSDLLPEEFKFLHHTKLCSKCSTSLIFSLALSVICWWIEFTYTLSISLSPTGRCFKDPSLSIWTWMVQNTVHYHAKRNLIKLMFASVCRSLIDSPIFVSRITIQDNPPG
jgi:hypothetical protein